MTNGETLREALLNEPLGDQSFSERVAGKLKTLLTSKYTNSQKIAAGIIKQELEAALAAPVQAEVGLREACPTCKGERVIQSKPAGAGHSDDLAEYVPCPDCWIAKLAGDPGADGILKRIALRYKNCMVNIYPDLPELTPVEGVLRCAAEEGFVLVARSGGGLRRAIEIVENEPLGYLTERDHEVLENFADRVVAKLWLAAESPAPADECPFWNDPMHVASKCSICGPRASDPAVGKEGNELKPLPIVDSQPEYEWNGEFPQDAIDRGVAADKARAVGKEGMGALASEWRKRAAEIEEKFGVHREEVCTHAEVLRMCAKELEAVLRSAVGPGGASAEQAEQDKIGRLTGGKCIEALASRREIAGEGPKIVCLCGSTRFYEAFMEANYRETMAGRIVLSVGFFMHRPDTAHSEDVGCTPEQKIALDELHKRKIDLADEIYVLNVGGYIGSSTRSEIEYAEAHGKPIRYLEARAALAGERADK